LHFALEDAAIYGIPAIAFEPEGDTGKSCVPVV
jgi:hypothetical protein